MLRTFPTRPSESFAQDSAYPSDLLGMSSLSMRRHHSDDGGGGGGSGTPGKAGGAGGELPAEVRARGVWSLAESADMQALPGLKSLLSDPDFRVREATAEVIGRIAQRNSEELSADLVESLGIVFQNDPHAGVRYSSAVALGRGRNSEAFFPLLAGFSDVYPEVMSAVAWAMGELRDIRALAPLCIQAKSPHFNVRAACIRALAKLKNGQCFDALAAALKDTDFEVRCEAAEALGKLGHPKAAGLLVDAVMDTHREVSEAATCSLVLLGSIAVPAIQAAMEAQGGDKPVAPKSQPAVGRLKRALALITSGSDTSSQRPRGPC